MPYGSRLLVEGSNNSSGWVIGGWTKEGTGRIEMGGPVVNGPHAFIFGSATVIASNPNLGTRAELERAKAKNELYEAKDGDKVVLPSGTYEILIDRRKYVRLVALDGPVPYGC